MSNLAPLAMATAVPHPEMSPPSVPKRQPHRLDLHMIWMSLLGSWYVLGCFVVAIVLHRIHHFVAPPNELRRAQQRGERLHLARLARRNHGNTPLSLPERIRRLAQLAWSTILPIDPSSTKTRLIIRIPAVILLYRALLLLTIILGQTSGTLEFSSYEMDGSLSSRIWTSLMSWAAQQEMKDVCQKVWLTVCFALLSSSLSSGLEGRGYPSESFSLFNFSSTMYLLSLDRVHDVKSPHFRPRPDPHGLIIVIIPLLELLIHQTLSLRREWTRLRLISSGVSVVLSIIHYWVSVLLGETSLFISLQMGQAWINLALMIVTSISLALYSLNSLLLEGSFIPTPTGPATPTWSFSMNDDFRVVNMKFAAAALNTTNMTGFANEMGSVVLKSDEVASWRAPKRQDVVQITPSGAAVVRPPANNSKSGFRREIRAVEAMVAEFSDPLFGGWLERRRLRAAWALLREIKNTVVAIYRRAKKRFFERSSTRMPDETNRSTPDISVVNASQLSDSDEGDHDYRRFLRGQSILSDDDSDYQDDEQEGERDSDQDDDPSDHDVAGDVSMDLLKDMELSETPVLLSHLIQGSSASRPLTRRRYREDFGLMEGQMAIQRLRQEWVGERTDRNVSGPQEPSDCVVCITEPRTVICWPCRCLTLCDDCRANLATLPTSQHLCPCCRSPVEGYSRIFTP